MSLKKIKACLLGMLTVFIGGINFGTVTSGQDYTLGHVDAKQRQGVIESAGADGYLFPDSNWCRLMIYPNQANLHKLSPQ